MGKVSSLIIWEQSTFFAALFMGMMFAFIYDCIRVFRRVFKHKHVYTMAVEDILFWFYVSIRVFTCLYQGLYCNIADIWCIDLQVRIWKIICEIYDRIIDIYFETIEKTVLID